MLTELSNYPNPFCAGRENTTIFYSLRENSEVEMGIYNYLGNRIIQWRFSAGTAGGQIGTNRIPWNGRDGKGVVAGPGGYICRLVVQTSDGKKTFKRKIGVVGER